MPKVVVFYTYAKKAVHTRAGMNPEKMFERKALFSCNCKMSGKILAKLSGDTSC